MKIITYTFFIAFVLFIVNYSISDSLNNNKLSICHDQVSQGIANGASSLNNNHLDEAEKLLLDAINLDCADTFQYIQLGYYLLGELYIKKEKYNKAIDILHEGLKYGMNKSKIYKNIGIAYFKQAKYIESENYLKMSLENDNNLPGCHYYLGLIYLSEGKIDSALTEFKKEIEICEHTGALEEIQKIQQNAR